MNNLKAKLKKQGGFTLIEMLIVVAIIAILIAIAIPMINTALERAREATDSANERAAYGLAYVAYMSNEPNSDAATKTGISTAGGTTYYVVEDNKGELKNAYPTGDVTLYGKGTMAGDIEADNTGKIIAIKITPATDTAEEEIELKWLNATWS